MVRALISLAALALAGCTPVAEESTTAPRDSEVGGALFVAGKFGNTLARIDLASGEETARVESCANPHELATSPDDRHVALACYGGRTVDIFRTADLGKVKSIELGEGARPHGIVWHANGDIYATAEGRRSIFWIRDPLGAAEAFEYGSGQDGTHMLAVAPDGRHAWTTNLGSRTVSLIDLKTRRVEIAGIALDGQGEWRLRSPVTSRIALTASCWANAS